MLDVALKRGIEQNLSWNADLDFIATNRLKITFSATTEFSEFKSPISLEKVSLSKISHEMSIFCL